MNFAFKSPFRGNLRVAGLTAILALSTLLSACGGDATATTSAPVATATTAMTGGATATTAMTGEGTATAAPAAPTNTTVSVGGGSVLLNGSGATFPVPLYTKWFQEYSTNVNKDITFNYQGTGSGAGITAITNKTVDFAGSDASLSDAQITAAPNLIQIPTVAGAVVLVYNVEGVATGLVLDGETVAGMFLGTITKWNDPKIAALNPGVTLPDVELAVVHRSDGSGTSNIFTSYLSAVSPEWESAVGTGTTVNWPVGLGGRGNPGVAAAVQQTPNAVGYVELAYAEQNKMSFAKMKNAAGQVVDASPASTTAASNGITIPDDFRISLVNSSDAAAWPIAGFTYLMVYKDMNNINDANKANALGAFLWWSTHEGQSFADALLYAKPSAELTTKIETALKAVTFQGQPVIKQ